MTTCTCEVEVASSVGDSSRVVAVPSSPKESGSLPALSSGVVANATIAATYYFVPLFNYNPDFKLIINNLFAARTSICR